MHYTALQHAKLFFQVYGAGRENAVIAEIGSQDVNGSLRQVAPPTCKYIGLDFAAGRGVDLIMQDPYTMPLGTGTVDLVVSSSCFEHAEFFWLTFLETLRILKDDGLVYINIPSNGFYHRFPTDSWRFYPDAGLALNRWALRNGYNSTLMESFIGAQHDQDVWNDFVCVVLKDRRFAAKYPIRMHPLAVNPTNIHINDEDAATNSQPVPQDVRRCRYLVMALNTILNNVAKA